MCPQGWTRCWIEIGRKINRFDCMIVTSVSTHRNTLQRPQLFLLSSSSETIWITQDTCPSVGRRNFANNETNSSTVHTRLASAFVLRLFIDPAFAYYEFFSSSTSPPHLLRVMFFLLFWFAFEQWSWCTHASCTNGKRNMDTRRTEKKSEAKQRAYEFINIGK